MTWRRRPKVKACKVLGYDAAPMLLGSPRRARPLAAFVALAGACATDDPAAVELRLGLADGGCTAEHVASISLLAIEVYGQDAGRVCKLASRCIFNVDLPQAPASLSDLERAMKAANQPLIDTLYEGSSEVAVLGRMAGTSCFSARDAALCAYGELADAEDGTLTLTARCDGCASEEIPLCP